MRRTKSQLGYTLIQLLVALELGTVVAAVGTPTVFNVYANYQLRSMSSELAFDIMRARAEAIGQNKYVRIKQISSTQYTRDTSADLTTWTTERTVTMPNGVTIGPGTAEVRFDKRGFGLVIQTMWVVSGGRLRYVTTSVIGKVTLV